MTQRDKLPMDMRHPSEQERSLVAFWNCCASVASPLLLPYRLPSPFSPLCALSPRHSQYLWGASRYLRKEVSGVRAARQTEWSMHPLHRGGVMCQPLFLDLEETANSIGTPDANYGPSRDWNRDKNINKLRKTYLALHCSGYMRIMKPVEDIFGTIVYISDMSDTWAFKVVTCCAQDWMSKFRSYRE